MRDVVPKMSKGYMYSLTDIGHVLNLLMGHGYNAAYTQRPFRKGKVSPVPGGSAGNLSRLRSYPNNGYQGSLDLQRPPWGLDLPMEEHCNGDLLHQGTNGWQQQEPARLHEEQQFRRQQQQHSSVISRIAQGTILINRAIQKSLSNNNVSNNLLPSIYYSCPMTCLA